MGGVRFTGSHQGCDTTTVVIIINPCALTRVSAYAERQLEAENSGTNEVAGPVMVACGKKYEGYNSYSAQQGQGNAIYRQGNALNECVKYK